MAINKEIKVKQIKLTLKIITPNRISILKNNEKQN